MRMLPHNLIPSVMAITMCLLAAGCVPLAEHVAGPTYSFTLGGEDWRLTQLLVISDPCLATPNSVAVSPDGSMVACGGGYFNEFRGGNHGDVRLWDLKTGRQMRVFPHKSQVLSVEFGPDGKTLIVGSGGTILWNLRTGKKLGWAGAGVAPCSYSLRRGLVVIGGVVVHVDSGKVEHDLNTTRNYVPFAAFSADGSILTGLRSADRPDKVRTLTELRSAVRPDDGSLRQWRTSTWEEIDLSSAKLGSFRYGEISPDGSTLVVCVEDGSEDRAHGTVTASAWQASPFAKKADVARNVRYDDPLWFSPDGLTFTIETGEAIRVWDARTWKERTPIKYQHSLRKTRVSSDGRCIFLQSEGGPTARVYDMTNSSEIVELEQMESYGRTEFSPGGNFLMTVGSMICFRDTKTWRKLLDVRALDESGVEAVAFSSDGRVLATVGYDRKLRVWGLTKKGGN